MISFIRHTWFKGHGVTVNRYHTTLQELHGGRGWLFSCECGKKWAR